MRFNISKVFLTEEYINNKLSANQIAKIIGCSDVTIYNRMKEYKIQSRTCSEGIKLNHPRLSGESHPGWKGGRNEQMGYILVYSPKHPNRNNHGYVKEHRLVMEKHIGRYLTPEEVVHHRGIKFPMVSLENRSDNRLENLRLFASNSEHIAYHRYK